MKTIRQFVIVLLVAVLFGYPAMACLSSAAEMTEAERECCKHMAEQCGSMDMPASHSCCQTEVHRPSSMLRVASAQVVPPAISEVHVSDLTIPQLATGEFPVIQLHSPPESPPGFPSILRI